jgi:phosphonate transport system ATP-binding protein
MLRLDSLTKRYPTGDLALSDVSLEIPKGQVMALIGPPRAGKSTLLRCITRLVEPTSGSAILDGENLTKGARWA